MRIVSAHSFKLLNHAPRATRLLDELGVRKEAIEPVVKVDERTLKFTITSDAVDRDNDRISVAGWQFDAYQKNPVVLWAHRADELPIGKTIDIERRDNRIAAVVRFLPEEGYGRASDLSDTVYRLARDNYLAATSVGFRPIKWAFSKDRGDDDFWPGIDFEEQELVELSIVSVPANPDALIEPEPVLASFERDEKNLRAPGQKILEDAESETRARRQRRVFSEIMGIR